MELVLVGLIWGIAGLIHGISGFGGAIIAVAFLSLFLPLQFIVPLAIITSMGLNIIVSLKYRQYCEYKLVPAMLLTALPGIALGTYVLTYIHNAYIQFSMGIFLLFFVAWQYFNKKVTHGKDSLWKRLLASFGAGFAFASTSLGGPPVAIYVLHAGWSPEKTLGTTGLFFFFIGLFSLPGLAVANLFSYTLMEYSLVSIITIGIGLRLSFRFIKKGGMELFIRSLLIVIFLSALLCLYSSTTAIMAL